MSLEKQFESFVICLKTDLKENYIDRYGNELPKPFKFFTKAIYEELNLNNGFIAHYDRLGFYNTYFNGNLEYFKVFLHHFLNSDKEVDFKEKSLDDYAINPYNNSEISLKFAEILKKNLDDLILVFTQNTLNSLQLQKVVIEKQISELS
ncbi:MAG: hypothetical protein AABY22_13120 [Nanoarchaeota archaeon]